MVASGNHHPARLHHTNHQEKLMLIIQDANTTKVFAGFNKKGRAFWVPLEPMMLCIAFTDLSEAEKVARQIIDKGRYERYPPHVQLVGNP